MPESQAPEPLIYAAARPMGFLLLLLAACMGACAPAGLLAETSGAVSKMVVSALIVAAFGGLLLLLGRHVRREIGRREAMVVVGLGWVAAGVFGGVPFVVSAGMSPADAFFETVSGFTTTGATILPVIEGRLDPAVHLWRTATHWLGGLGIVVLFVALFPVLGVGGKHLFRTESAGPPSGGLAPRIRETARSLWRVYLALTLAEIALLYVAGLPMFEAVTHSFSTMGTGGFSTRNASVAAFDSVWVDLIVTVFMIVAGVNFGVFYEATQRGWRALVQNTELKVYLAIAAISTLIVTVDIARRVYEGDLGTSLRYASFQVASIMTTTGFGTADFEKWPALSQVVLVILYFIGGSAGSTAGGVKVIRVIIVGHLLFNEMRRGWRPALVAPIRVGKRVVPASVTTEVLAYCALFVITVAVGAVWVGLVEHEVDLVTAFMSSLACVANVGPGLGDVGPIDNYGFFSAPTKVFLSVLMLIGRLEGFALLALVLPGFWRR